MDITKLTGYTPGPLHVAAGFVLSQTADALADCYIGQPATPGRNANAQLYAAAPHLLDLAKLGLELADSVSFGNDHERDCELARAYIEKATR
jgi:hypothetical protein